MNARLILLALPLLAACDAQQMQDLKMPWDRTPPAAAAPAVPATPAEPPKPVIPEPTGAAPTEAPLEVEGTRTKVATANAETLNVTRVDAAGDGWTATVDGKTVRFERPGAKAAAVTVRRLTYAGGVEYVGTLNDEAVTLNLTSADCGGKPLTAKVRANGKTYAGCAAPSGTVAKAAATEAAKPADKPKA